MKADTHVWTAHNGPSAALACARRPARAASTTPARPKAHTVLDVRIPVSAQNPCLVALAVTKEMLVTTILVLLALSGVAAVGHASRYDINYHMTRNTPK